MPSSQETSLNGMPMSISVAFEINVLNKVELLMIPKGRGVKAHIGVSPIACSKSSVVYPL